nr:xylulose kinase-1 [Tanacetum cinerariifolium]
MNTDHNLWKVIQNGNSKKSLGRYSKGGIIILPPVSFKEHVAVQREMKARTLLLQSLLEYHMADFHHLDDAREIWLAVKARFGGNEESKKMRKTMLKQEFSELCVSEEEGLHKGYDRFQNILSQLNQMQAKPYNDDVNLKFLRALPPSWSQVALTLKTRGGLKYLSFNDLYNKLRSLEIDIKSGSSYGSKSTIVAPTHSAFIGATSTNTKMVYSDQPSYSSLISYTPVPAGSILEDVLHSFIAGRLTSTTRTLQDLIEGRKDATIVQLGHFARECNVKKVDEKARYSAFKISEAKIEKKEWEVKLVESLARFDKWKEPSKNLAKLINSSMTTKTKLGLGFKKYFGIDEAFDLLTPSIFDREHVTREVKSLYEWFVKAGDMHEVPPTITGTFMLTSSKSVLEETQVTFGSKSPTSITTSEANDFVSCDNNDKSSVSKTHDFASCVSSPLPADSFSPVDVKILPKFDVQAPSPTNGVSSCSIQENVNPPSDFCNKPRIAGRNNCNNTFVRTKTCFVCGSKSYLIKDCHVYDTIDNFLSVVLKAASVPAGSRNSSASTSAGRSILAASINRSASIHAGSSITVASRNRSAFIHAGRSIPAASRNRSSSIHAGSSIPAA